MENILLNTPVAYFIFPLQNSEQAELSVGHGHLHHESEEQAGWIEKIALRCYSKSQDCAQASGHFRLMSLPSSSSGINTTVLEQLKKGHV